jgi:hypothetical protein
VERHYFPLSSHGARQSLIDDQVKTPFDLAAEAGQAAAFGLLWAHDS